MNQNMHNGHRKRLKERFLKEGIDSFDAHNVLELLLFYSIPYKDTNPIAHRLLETFGGISNTFDAPMEELMKIEGIGYNTALLLKLIPQLCRRYMDEKAQGIDIIADSIAAGEFLRPKFIGRTNEMVAVVCLDNKNKVLSTSTVLEGSINAAQINIRRIVEIVIKYRASSVILAHNHPGGLALPSKEDIITTRNIKKALDSIGVALMDHIIIADGDYVSLADSGILTQMDS